MALDSRAPTCPDAVIFDMDGVIADTEPLHGHCFVRAFAEFGISVTLEEYRRAVTVGKSTAEFFFCDSGGDAESWARLVKVKDEWMAAVVAERASLLPGVVKLLDLLRDAKIPAAVATSARRRSLEIILDHFGLWPYFRCCSTKDEVGVEKPDPAVFLHSARALGAEPAHCVVIEDSPRGVAAACRAGMPCIVVPTASTEGSDFTGAATCVSSLLDVDLALLSAVLV